LSGWSKFKNADGLENKDGNDRDGDSENGGAGGVLRASGAGADAGGLENKDRQGVDDDGGDGDDNCERRSNTDVGEGENRAQLRR
jgi:hypothetical protein